MAGGGALVAVADRPLTRFAAFFVAVVLSFPVLAAGEEPEIDVPATSDWSGPGELMII